MNRIVKASVPADVFSRICAMRNDEDAFTDASLIITGLINQVYEREAGVPFGADFLSADNVEGKRIYARLNTEEDDTAGEYIVVN